MDVQQQRIDLLGRAIGDLHGTIRANDAKSSAGLVVHGLLAAAVGTTSGKLGSVYDDASVGAQILIWVALGAALVLFLLSVGCLLLAILPYEPETTLKHMPKDAGFKPIYFPLIDVLSGKAAPENSEAEQFLRDARDLNTPERIEEQYATELVKIAEIRHYEARWTKLGFRLLFAEISCVVVLVATIVVVAAS